MPVEALRTALQGISYALVMEETCKNSGLHESVAWALPECRLDAVDLGKDYTTHGSLDKLYKEKGLDAASVAAHIQEVLSLEN